MGQAVARLAEVAGRDDLKLVEEQQVEGGVGTLAECHDCRPARPPKHLKELQAIVAPGDRAVELFDVQRTDCDAVAARHELDPAFAQGLDQAEDNGVEVLADARGLTTAGVDIGHRLPLDASAVRGSGPRRSHRRSSSVLALRHRP